MTTARALIPILVASALAGCAGTKQMPGSPGAGGATGAGGGPTGTGGGAPATTGAGGSASGAGGQLGATGGSVAGNNCGLYQFQPTPRNADILMVLDRSGSMQDVPAGAPAGSTATKWQIVVPAMEQIVTATQSSISWGLKTFPEAATDDLSACKGALTGTPDVAVAPRDGAPVNAAIAATTPAGNGTPTGDAIKAAAAYLETLGDANPKVLLLATDGEPSCVGTTEDSSGAGPYAVQAVGDALAAGFKTFVVGIATTKTSDNSRPACWRTRAAPRS
jgi:hypothetical protein